VSETQIEPQSIAADNEPQADPDLSFYRVLQLGQHRKDGGDVWYEVGTLTNPHVPTASDVGKAFGEGNYLLIEKDSKYSFLSTYEMRVVAEKRFRLAEDA
jgi:hypothetical protein